MRLFFRITDSKIPPLTKSEAEVAVGLACGSSKKEIAVKRHRSIHTIVQQARMVYEKTGCKNLADLTRWVIAKYKGVSEQDLITGMQNALIAFFAIGLLAVLASKQLHETIQLAAANLINQF